MPINQTTFQFILLAVLFGFIYLIMIRPQMKQQKKIQSMRNSLDKGDKIITIGGFYGKVVAIKDDILTVELKPDNVKVQITKSAVGEVISQKEEKAIEKPKDEDNQDK